MKVLVIDDSRFQKNHNVRLLKESGFETCQANDGNAGLEVLESEVPDVIFCDLLMPEMDGFAFLEELKKRGHKVPVVILSSNTQKAAKDQCKELGALCFLNKPLSLEQIEKQVKPLLQELQKEVA